MAEPQRRRRAPKKPDEPLGSLSQPAPVPEHARACVACASRELTRVSMTLGDGTPVMFVSCQACEHRTWVAEDGEHLDAAGVLRRAGKQ